MASRKETVSRKGVMPGTWSRRRLVLYYFIFSGIWLTSDLKMPDRREKPPVKIRQAELFPGNGVKMAFDRTALHRKGFEKPPYDFLPT